jgi:hypothetical protein
MPYITKAEQQLVDQNPVYGRGNPGVLAYRINKLIIEWLGKEPHYADYVAALGALSDADVELHRRSFDPFKDRALARNGDIYPDWLLPEPDAAIVSEEIEPVVEKSTTYEETQARYFL